MAAAAASSRNAAVVRGSYQAALIATAKELAGDAGSWHLIDDTTRQDRRHHMRDGALDQLRM